MVLGKDGYKSIWNDEPIKELRENATSSGIISVYVDHCAEEKRKIVLEQEMNNAYNGESFDPNYDEDDECQSQH